MTVQNPSPNTPLEERLQKIAAGFPYPRTPDIAGRALAALNAPAAGGPAPRAQRRRTAALRLALAVTILLLALLAVPGVRAALLEILQFGPVRLFLVAPTPEPTSAEPLPTPTLLPSLLELEGHTSLEEAQARLDFPIHVPALPQDLGLPDYVFLQDMDGPVLFLAWSDPEKPNRLALVLQQLAPGSIAVEKYMPEQVEYVTVNGKTALWTSGPYLVRLRNGDYQLQRMATGHVLIWRQDEYTYRLESDLPLETAIQIAESIHPWQPER